jgi:hypothetical protein
MGCPGNTVCAANGQCDSTLGQCVCDSAHFGADCQYDTCGAASSLRPGLVVKFYDGKPFEHPRALTYIPSLDVYWPGAPLPNVGARYYSAVVVGLLRPFETGAYAFGMVTTEVQSYTIFVGGQLMGLGVSANLTAHANVRLKVEVSTNWGAVTLKLQWRRTDLLGSSMQTVGPDSLLHEVVRGRRGWRQRRQLRRTRVLYW